MAWLGSKQDHFRRQEKFLPVCFACLTRRNLCKKLHTEIAIGKFWILRWVSQVLLPCIFWIIIWAKNSYGARQDYFLDDSLQESNLAKENKIKTCSCFWISLHIDLEGYSWTLLWNSPPRNPGRENGAKEGRGSTPHWTRPHLTMSNPRNRTQHKCARTGASCLIRERKKSLELNKFRIKWVDLHMRDWSVISIEHRSSWEFRLSIFGLSGTHPYVLFPLYCILLTYNWQVRLQHTSPERNLSTLR